MHLTLTTLYQKMLREMGPSGWWPGDSREEIIVGAILIQNTNWRNADQAMTLFRQVTAFDPDRLLALPTDQLQALVRPAGFYRNKSRSLVSVFSWLKEWRYDYAAIHQHYGLQLRQRLLALRGVGQETADVFLTYIFDVPTFIADKYARTLFTQLGVANLTDYQSLARRCQLPTGFTTAMTKDFHGQIDEFGKVYFHPLTKFQDSFLAGDRLILPPTKGVIS
ncbi:deoxyribonuclease I [uncultured Limosilactobacillus sp.]|uniref:endonuclease III domain-containing protein n=1 Tax=uncultured Limosilactobacillus sp. TaxID=2837629 RepID=UPI0025CDA023|nr:deoxyribonuclease I [uncultured Limosilactobacillus sp.]